MHHQFKKTCNLTGILNFSHTRKFGTNLRRVRNLQHKHFNNNNNHNNNSSINNNITTKYNASFIRSISVSTPEKALHLDPLNPELSRYRKTKIIATVGPSSWDEKGIKGLLHSGMNVLRINCSHGDHQMYEKVIKLLRKCVSERDLKHNALRNDVCVSCAVALDTKGPEIRLGDFEVEQPVEIIAGKTIKLHTNEKWREKQTGNDLFVDYPKLKECLSTKSKIFIDDGLLCLEVTSFAIDGDGKDTIVCKANNTAKISSRKGVNLPGAVLDLPAVSEKDRTDLEFARKQKVDFIFASFIRRKEHVEAIREIVGPNIGIIAKIENAEGIQNIDGIIQASDGIMVARGDLGIEIPQENVFLAQKLIVSKCNLVGKPVICATQMLDSMSRSPRPTRAECADTANAVLDGCDAVMLSGETANGLYPAETVATMSQICQTAEYSIDFRNITDAIRKSAVRGSKLLCEALIVSAVVAAFEEDAKMLIVLSETGISAQLASKYRPQAVIMCVTTNLEVARQLQISHGITTRAIPEGMSVQDSISQGMKIGYKWGLVEAGDRIVAVHSQGSVMRLLEVPEWVTHD